MAEQVFAVSRQGGDEFVVALSPIARLEDAALSVTKIIAAVIARTQSTSTISMSV